MKGGGIITRSWFRKETSQKSKVEKGAGAVGSRLPAGLDACVVGTESIVFGRLRAPRFTTTSCTFLTKGTKLKLE